MAQPAATVDHEFIRHWIEERGGRPAAAAGTRKRGLPRRLRITFDPRDDSLEPIGWQEFFSAFEHNELAFLYQEKTNDGEVSRFCKFVDRNYADADDADDRVSGLAYVAFDTEALKTYRQGPAKAT